MNGPKMKKLALILSAIVLSACETPRVSQQEATSVSYGPKPIHWQQVIRDHLGLRLTDPKSAIVEFRTEPKQLFQRAVALEPQYHGWAVCVWVNDKNPDGTYA